MENQTAAPTVQTAQTLNPEVLLAPPVKPGVLTSEFYLALSVIVINFLVRKGLIDNSAHTDTMVTELAGILSRLVDVAALGIYTWARTVAKRKG